MLSAINMMPSLVALVEIAMGYGRSWKFVVGVTYAAGTTARTVEVMYELRKWKIEW